MKKQLLVIQELLPEQLTELKEIASDYEVIESVEEASIERVEIIIGWSAEARKIVESEKSDVKWVQFAYSGVNQLPLELFKEKGITLTNSSGVNSNSVSETAFGLLLGMTRNIVNSGINQLDKKWDVPSSMYLLAGKTVLIAGIGRIGKKFAEISKAFDMKTIGINQSGRKVDFMDKQYLQTDLNDVIGQADIVVNILPLTKETKNLYNKDLFEQMKDDVVFINVGRGESVNTEDLLEYLDNGKILHAGLDVYDVEPLPTDSPLWSHEKVLAVPHIGGILENYPRHIYPLFEKNLKAYLNEEPLENVVELDKGY